jgi:hypothetical protein
LIVLEKLIRSDIAGSSPVQVVKALLDVSSRFGTGKNRCAPNDGFLWFHSLESV